MDGIIQINVHITGLMPQQYNSLVKAVDSSSMVNEARKLINSRGIDKESITSCIFIADKIYIPLENL